MFKAKHDSDHRLNIIRQHYRISDVATGNMGHMPPSPMDCCKEKENGENGKRENGKGGRGREDL